MASLTRTASDSAAQTDAATQSAALQRSISESAALSDDLGRSVLLSRSVTEAVAQAQVAMKIRGRSRSTSDAWALSQDGARAGAFRRAIGESLLFDSSTAFWAKPSETRRRQNLLEPGSLVELFVLDLTSKGGTLVYFHNSNMYGTGVINFQGHGYQPWPIVGDGFEKTMQQGQPRPKMTVANLNGEISALCRAYGDLVGCALQRKKTFVEFLDDGATPNAAEEYTPEIWTVNQRTAETMVGVEFELATPWDTEGIMLPFRQIKASYCGWFYRGAECGFAGQPVTDKFGNMFGPNYTATLVAPNTITSATAAFTSTDVGLYVGGHYAIRAGTRISAVSGGVATVNTALLASGPINLIIGRLVGGALYNAATTYQKWQFAYTMALSGARVYWVSLVDSNTQPLTDTAAWAMDACTKKLAGGCKQHFGWTAALPTEAFPGAANISSGA